MHSRAAPWRTTSSRVSGDPPPCKTRMLPITSRAFPMWVPMGWSMVVSWATVLMPSPSAVRTMEVASSLAWSTVCMNAADPVLTSNTNAVSPSAAFFEMMDAVMSGTLSIVCVTSRMAYNTPSAGAMASFWTAMQHPTALTASTMASGESAQLNPGMASNLSMVPPVWPNPRPANMGTRQPAAANAGASTRDILSPTPPVLCLSTTGGPSPHDRLAPEAIIDLVKTTVSSVFMPC